VQRQVTHERQPPSQPFGSSAVLGSFGASLSRRRGGGEDPWLCGPGFRRVCLCRRCLYVRYGTGGVKQNFVWTGRQPFRL